MPLQFYTYFAVWLYVQTYIVGPRNDVYCGFGRCGFLRLGDWYVTAPPVSIENGSGCCLGAACKRYPPKSRATRCPCSSPQLWIHAPSWDTARAARMCFPPILTPSFSITMQCTRAISGVPRTTRCGQRQLETFVNQPIQLPFRKRVTLNEHALLGQRSTSSPSTKKPTVGTASASFVSGLSRFDWRCPRTSRKQEPVWNKPL